MQSERLAILDEDFKRILRAYPDNSLASTGCVGRGLRQAASTMLDIACFAFLVHNRIDSL